MEIKSFVSSGVRPYHHHICSKGDSFTYAMLCQLWCSGVSLVDKKKDKETAASLYSSFKAKTKMNRNN